MSRRNTILSLFAGAVLLFSPLAIYADSATRYQDYLYQFDIYRKTLNEFKVARAEYLKFNTLTSQQTALEKTKKLLADRSYLLRTYLLFLNEKVGESTFMQPTTKTLSQTLINDEIKFLEKHASLASAIGSLTDAEGVSQQLTGHYTILQSSIYQTIVSLKVAELSRLDAIYYNLFSRAYELIQTNRSSYAPEKQSTLDHWLLQIQNKRSLYQQKMDAIAKENNTLRSSSLNEITAAFDRIQKILAESRQYLSEGTGYLSELSNAMQYKE